ncbi:hypothetical protein ACFOU2_09615 [Bacillus songklensis]|uniref:Uncharacterized protein n=1 Tax=Bacillus songklensis TaxID=1069116 RepID=A0ABV8B0E2_9BACI
MGASFILELDTTGPVIEAFGPSYATNLYPETIIIEANETLADYQDIYFIDAAGTRHDVIFSYQTNKFVGVVYFSLFVPGIATMYARLMDEVNNLSNTAIYYVNVVSAIKLDITINDFQRMVRSEEVYRSISLSEEARGIVLSSQSREVQSRETTRIIEVSEFDHIPGR